jgi:hypothetical protein
MASYVLAEAKDGYRVVFALAELILPSPIPRYWSRTPRTESRCPMAKGHFGSSHHRKSAPLAGFVCFSESRS